MYKLREERLKELYAPVESFVGSSISAVIMAQQQDTSTKFSLSKNSVTGSHGDSLADHSFESFKTKEIRDSESPTRFGTVIPSDNSGWHITTSQEVSADGKTHTVRSSATTEGTKEIDGGKTSFSGKNEEAQSERFEGDDTNFVHSKGDQSSTFLTENTVVEGDNGCKIEKKSSSTISSSSKIIRSKHVIEDETDFVPVRHDQRDTLLSEGKGVDTFTSSTREEHTKSNLLTHQIDGNISSKHLSKDPDRVSEAFRLMELPGEVLQREVTVINPTTKMITVTKKLEDGTTVTTRSYERVDAPSKSSTVTNESHVRRDSEINSKFSTRDETEIQTTKKDVADKVINQQFIVEERTDTQRNEQIKKHHQQQQQQQHEITNNYNRITVELDAAHDSFARSLRCASPTGSVRSVRSNSTTGRSSVSPDKSYRNRRSPSRDSDTSRLSTHTTTRSSRTDVSSKDYMKPTLTSERRQSNYKEHTIHESSSVVDSSDIVEKSKPKERSTSPKKVPQNTPDMTPRGPSPDKLSRHTSPSKTPKDAAPFCTVNNSRGTSPQKLRDTKTTSAKLVRENSSESFNIDTTITVSTNDNLQQRVRDDVEVFTTKSQITDLDDITINVKLENVTDDIEVTTTVEEVDMDKKKSVPEKDEPPVKKAPKQKPPLVRSETFEERCRKILGMPGNVDTEEEVVDNVTSSIFSTYDNTLSSETREKRMKMENEVKTNQESSKQQTTRKTNDFLDYERMVETQHKTSPEPEKDKPTRTKETSQDRKPSESRTSPTRKYYETSPNRRPDAGTSTVKPSEPKESSPVRKYSQPSPDRRPKESSPAKKPTESKESSPVRKYSQPSPDRRPKEESPAGKQSDYRNISPVRKHSQASPERRSKEQSPHKTPTEKAKSPSPIRKPSQPSSDRPKEQSPMRKPSDSKESSPVRKYSQPSPDRRPVDLNVTRKPSESKEASPVRKPSQPSPHRSPLMKPSEPLESFSVRKVSHPSPERHPREQTPVRKSPETKETSPPRCSRSKERSTTPTDTINRKSPTQHEKPSTRKPSTTSPMRKTSRDTAQTETTVVKSKVTSKADILVNQNKEGKNMSVTEITIQPQVDAKKSDKILAKQTSDNKFDRRSTSSRAVTSKSSSDFDVKRRTHNEKSETVVDKTIRTTTNKSRTPATSPDKRRPLDSSPTKTDKGKHHITVAKIKIEPVRKPVQARIIVDDRSSRSAKTIKTTKKIVDDFTEPESDKDTGISDNEIDDETVTTVETTTTTVTSSRRHPATDRKDSAPVYRTTARADKEYSRSSSDNVLKSNTTTKKTHTTKTSTTSNNTTASPKKTERPVKCVTTKTINLSTKATIDSDNLDNVVIDIQQAKSSREPTPNRLIPIPVSPDEDTGKPRYPDAVQEPDDEPRQAPRVNNIPIFEEATNEYIGCEISEIEDHEVRAARASRITNLDRVTEDDESLLSVTQKVSKFVEEANRLKDDTATKAAPNRFVRHEYEELDEHLRSDECLLSVSDKVTKFISTAEEVKKIKTSKPFTPDREIDTLEPDESRANVNERVSKFSTNDSNRTSLTRETVEKMDQSWLVEKDESLLSVSEKKKKFIAGSNAPQKSPELVKNIMKQTTRQERDEEGAELDQKTNIVDRYTTTALTKPRDKVPQTVTLRSTEAVKKAKEIFESSNKSTAAEIARQKDILSRPSIWEDRRKKEQATVTVAREPKADQSKNQKDVRLTDIGVFRKHQAEAEPESRKPTPEEPTQEAPKTRRDSGTPKTPAYIKDTVSTKKNLFEKKISSSKMEVANVGRSTTTTTQEECVESSVTHAKRPSITEKYERSVSRDTPTPGNKPSYMSHTVSSMEHMNTSRRESIDSTHRIAELKEQVHQQEAAPSKPSNKFGVELKRTDSGRNVIPALVKRKSSADIPHFEEIFNLELLEKMLETVTGYEQRRRIRAQIRLVKKMGEKPNSSTTTTTTVTTTTKMNSSRVRDTSPKRKEPSPTRVTRRGVQDTEVRSVKTVEVEKKSDTLQRSSSPTKPKSTTMNGKISTTVPTKTPKVTEKIAPTEPKDDKPIWATSNILKKASENTRNFKTASTTNTTTKKTITTIRDVPKEMKPTDCITSSYGVGPTDENGLPLFGIRALKKKPAETGSDYETTSKISGSSVSEALYSENGSAPIGERKTTVYSSDVRDFEDLNLSESKRNLAIVRDKRLERENSRKGLISLTKVEKITNGGSHVTAEEIGTLEDIPHRRPSKLQHRGSVKELTERFVHKESSSSLTSDKNYPKAGLILRSAQSHSSRASTPGEISSARSGSIDFDENDVELQSSSAISKKALRESIMTSTSSASFMTSGRTETNEEEVEDGVVFRKNRSSSSSRQTRSFLNDGSRVSGVQDVLERMRNADNVEESDDTEEDREARALLNKFLGASVLMSGMESMVTSSMKEESTSGTVPGSQKVSKVTTTRTVKSSASSNSASKPSVENLEQIWDEAVLKQLLESSTNYEERRKIRARLRQIMAEKEACADIVASVTADLQRERQLQKQLSTNNSNNNNNNSGIQGESLLLPLLQGILLNNKGGAGGGQVGTASGSGTVTTLSIPPVEDSGTESGEDLRLLAAGLHDNIEMYRGIGTGASTSSGGSVSGDGSSVSNLAPQENGESILHEVTAALQRLQLSLRDGKNMNLDTSKRNALLTLVCRLQTGLMQPEKLPEQVSPVNELIDDKEESIDYNQARRGSGRFSKRRNRNNRHTVGVSREELADARRFIEEFGRIESISSHSHSATPEKSKTPEKPTPPSRVPHKQPSPNVVPVSTPVAPTTTFAMKRPSQFVPKAIQDLKPAIKLNDSEPLVNGRDRKAKQKLFRQSHSFEQPPVNGHELETGQHKPIDVKSATTRGDPFKKPVQTAAQRALIKKYSFNDGSTSDEDEPQKNAEQVVLQRSTPKGSAVINTVQKIVSREVKQESPKPVTVVTAARKQGSSQSRTLDSHVAHMGGVEGSKPLNKYTSKKLRMKRANTIDIPKKLLSNEVYSDDDSEEERNPLERTRETKSKTPVSSVTKPAIEVPEFKPKTESDMKFMAFLQKQNQASKQVWSNATKDHIGSNNWTSKFDHLKSNFEHADMSRKFGPPAKSAPKNSAMNFWKKAESASLDETSLRTSVPSHASKPPKTGAPVPSNAVAKRSTQGQQPPKPSSVSQQPPKPKSVPQPVVPPMSASNRTSKIVPAQKPATVPSPSSNQFTHAPTSAFKPIPKKLPPVNLDFKPVHHEPDIIKPIPAHVSSGVVKQIVASGFKETPEVKAEPIPVQLGLVKSLAAAGYHETPYVPPPKLERTPTQLVLNYQAKPERPESPTSAAPWIGKTTTDNGSRVASIASTKFTANQFGLNKGTLPAQQPLTYQGSLKYSEKPLNYQQTDRLSDKRPSLPDVAGFSAQPTYTFTDFTQPELVSTFALNRSDSLTNPENQPLVLTSTNSVFSPASIHHAPQISYQTTNVQRDKVDDDDDDDDDLESVDSQEIRVVTRVMQAPVSQQASYSSNKPTHLGGSEERGTAMAHNLHSSLKAFTQKSPTPPNRLITNQRRDSSNSFDSQSSNYPQRAQTHYSIPRVEVTPQTPVSVKPQPQFSLPAHVIYNNVQGSPQTRQTFGGPQLNQLSRTDSWVRLNQQPAPISLARTKSSSTLAVPQNTTRALGNQPRVISDKQRTMEAYFSGQKPSFNPLAKTSSSHNILRDKSGMTQNSVRPVSYAMGHNYNPMQYNIMSSQPVYSNTGGYQPPSMYTSASIAQQRPQPLQSQYYQPPLGGGLARSRTMPHIPMNNLSLLDESNVDDAFEELMTQSFAV
ncbi:serine-rich adhesin for platelets-like isoform X2 [Toxorhynchites rutilus septentrionalis]|nr:serine-rich adhesin for platelets-like isoform X2 [Toxorhynchites rutilus septentrionalis]